MCIPYLPQDETIIETYKDIYDEVYMVYDDTPLCSPHGDESLKSSFPYNIFETRYSEEEYSEHEDECIQECDAMDKDSHIFDKGRDDDYWTYIKKPIFDVSREESVDLETFGDLGMEDNHVDFSYDHSESHTSVTSEDLEKQWIEESDSIQPMECQSQPTSSHSEVPHDLEQPGAYTKSYHPISPFDMYDGVVDLPHHINIYISPIQVWIEEACSSTYRFGRQFDEVLHAYDFSSSSPLLNIRAGLHFLLRISLFWLVTKHKRRILNFDQMLRWLHWIFHFT